MAYISSKNGDDQEGDVNIGIGDQNPWIDGLFGMFAMFNQPKE